MSDRSILKTLGWGPGDSLQITVIDSAVVVHPHSAGVFVVPPRPYLVLPALVRRRCGIHAGDRLLLAADPSHGALVVHPLAALDELLVAHHASLAGGEHDERESG
ncbi:hypothetical protein [Amycolatopsis sp. NPDC102389]|uniref:hypothetical protein n=1 Tax=Amycolatopsis sp. NPDC102389 TaxID=3363941 RepID=UPI00381F0B39